MHLENSEYMITQKGKSPEQIKISDIMMWIWEKHEEIISKSLIDLINLLRFMAYCIGLINN